MASIILKATEACNSNCIYCDVVARKDASKRMSFETLKTVYIRINEYLTKFKHEKIDITLHGGEPLILGTDYFLKMVELENVFCKSTKNKINYSIQTNLTLMSHDFVDALRSLRINYIGTSFDPCPNTRGPGKEIDSDSYNRLFLKGLDILKEKGVDYGVIYVVTRKSLERPRDIFFYLSNLFSKKSIMFNPVLIYDEERKGIAITPCEYAAFLGKVFEEWWEHKSRYPKIYPFLHLTDLVQKGALNLFCAEAGGCADSHINIDPSGNASQCGRSSDWGILPYGNIEERTLEDILRDPQREKLRERNKILPQTECSGCRFWFICHGGCPLDAYSSHKSFMHKSEWCDAKRLFIQNYFEPITGVQVEEKYVHAN